MTQSPEVSSGGPAGDNDELELGLVDLWYNLLDHRRLFGAIVAIFVLVGVLYAVVATPVYRADALLKVDQKTGSGLGALSSVTELLDIQDNSTDGEIQILKSRSIVVAAAKALGADLSVGVDSYFPVFGKWYALNHDYGNRLANPLLGLSGFAWGGEQLTVQDFSVPQRWLGQQFTVVADGADRWELVSPDGETLARGKAGVTTSFLLPDGDGVPTESKLTVSSMRARSGIRFSLAKLSTLDVYGRFSNSLGAAETEKGSGIISATFDSSDRDFAARFLNAVTDAYIRQNIASYAEQARLSQEFLSRQLPSIEDRLHRAEQALTQFRTSQNSADVAEQTADLLRQSSQVQEQIADGQLQLQALQSRYSNEFPTVIALKLQLASLTQTADTLEKQIGALPAMQQQYLRLARDVQVNSELYTALTINKAELQVVEASTTGNVDRIDAAVPPELPIRPKRGLIVIGAVVLGVMVSFGVVQLLAITRGTVRDPDTVERTSNKPLYAIIPDSATQRSVIADLVGRSKKPAFSLLAAAYPDDPAVENIRALRSAIDFVGTRQNEHVVLITGPTSGVGKSFVSANLAYLSAINGSRTLMIDMDMRRPSLKNYFPTNKTLGLSDVLSGRSTFDEAVERDVYPMLDVLHSGAIPSIPAELLAKHRFANLLEAKKGVYDYIIIDSPPILPVADTPSIASACDAVFLLTRASVTTRRQLIEAIKRIEQRGGEVTGLVFNGFLAQRYGSYGYGAYDYSYSSNETA